jgi:hypothetical protein
MLSFGNDARSVRNTLHANALLAQVQAAKLFELERQAVTKRTFRAQLFE